MKLTWLAVVSLFIFACSDSSTGPVKDDNGHTDSIGNGGGVVVADGVTLSVPAGALNNDSDIGISVTGDNGFGENAASQTFLFSGIPADFASPLTITIKPSKDLSHETYLVVETPVTEPMSAETVMLPAYYPVTAKGDSVTAEIPPDYPVLDKSARRHEEENIIDMYVTLVTDYTASLGESHFSIRAPWRAKETVNDLLPYFGRTYDRIVNLGFDLSHPGYNPGTLDSIKINVTNDVSDPPVFEMINAGEYKMGYMLIDEAYLYPDWIEEVKFDAARSLALMTALYYTPGDEFEPSFSFSIAMADWLAREYLYSGPEISSMIDSNPASVFEGIPLIPGTDTKAYEDYCAQSRRLAPIFEYLHDTFGLTGESHGLSALYNAFRNGIDYESAIETLTVKDSSEWWPDFVEAYITGQVWDVNPQVFLGTDAQKEQVTLSLADTTHTFYGSFGDLAADIYAVTLDAEYAGGISTLQFSAESSGLQDDYLNVLLFGIRNSEPYYIGRGINSIIADAGEASDNNTFIVAVTNSLIDYPYRDDTPYSLTVTGTKYMNEVSRIVLQLPYVWRSYEWVDNDGNISPAGGAGGPFTWNLDDFEKNGDTYTGTIVTTSDSDYWGHYTKTATITAVITGTEASANIHQVFENYDADTVSTETFEFWGLPRIDPAEGCLVSYGSTLEQYLNNEEWPNFVYTFHNIANVNPEGYTRQTEYSAGRGANIHLK